MSMVNNNEVNYFLENFPEWKYNNHRLKREYIFKNFKEAFSFMTLCALKAESIDHHPNWHNVYDQLAVELYTHTVNNITKLDIELATFFEETYQNLFNKEG